MKTTTQIIEHQRLSGTHPRDIGPGGRVSTQSMWESDDWFLDPPDRRKMPSAFNMNWSSFPSALVPIFKELCWSLFVSRPDGKPLSISRASGLCYSVRYLANWMRLHKRASFGSITESHVDVYVSELRSHLRAKAKDRDAEYDTASVNAYLKPIMYTFTQRRSLENAGLSGLAWEPFSGESCWSVAEEIAPYVESFTPPLPDEVVLPIVHQAHAFLGKPAEDVLHLISETFSLKDQKAKRGKGELVSERQFRKMWQRHLRKRAAEAGDDQPWLSELAGAGMSEDGAERTIAAFRRLMFDVLAACIIYIRFQSGVRHGEILSFALGILSTGLPVCVETEDSVSGAYELFLVNGFVEKGRDEPEETRWLLAGRVKGDDRLPDAVKALLLINRILAPWRALSSDPDSKTHLLLQFHTHGFPKNPRDISPMHATQLGLIMKDFIERRVDLSHLDANDAKLAEYIKHKGRNVQSKQWRKTWANFIFRTNGKLLPAISQQFQHSSTVLTQEAYIGKDAEQLGLVESAATERAVAFMERAMAGDRGIGGVMRKVVDGLDHLIPRRIDQNPWAHCRSPMDMMRQG